VRLLRPLLLPTLALLALALGAVPPQAQEQPQYEVIDLGTLGGERSEANAINDNGHVVGSAETGATGEDGERIRHAFLWAPYDGMRDLGTLGGPMSTAHDLNNRGVVVGSASGDDSEHVSRQHAFRWSAATGMAPLVAVRGSDSNWDSFAYAINDRGLIVGSWDFGSHEQKATLWKGGRKRILGSHGYHGRANDINEAGYVVGGGESSRVDNYRAFLWYQGRARHPMRNDPRTRACDSTGFGINNRGELVGEACGNAVLWWRDRLVFLVTRPGDRASRANAINERGRIVGGASNHAQSAREEAMQRAVLWEANAAHDLNALIPAGSGWELQEATDINESGQIVGYGLHHGVRRAFLLNPR